MDLVEMGCFKILKEGRIGWFDIACAKVFNALAKNDSLNVLGLAHETGLEFDEAAIAAETLASFKVIQRSFNRYYVEAALESLNALVELSENETQTKLKKAVCVTSV